MGDLLIPWVAGCSGPTVDVAPGAMAAHELVLRAEGLTAATCIAGDDRVSGRGAGEVVVRGLRASTTYRCEAALGARSVEVEASTGPLPAELDGVTFTASGETLDDLVLTNVYRVTGVASSEDQVLVVLDGSGDVRWSLPMPDSDEAIAADPSGDALLVGGGLFVSTSPRTIDVAGSVTEQAPVPAAHDVAAWGDGLIVVTPQLIGFAVGHYGWGGDERWIVRDGDDDGFPTAYVNSLEMIPFEGADLLLVSVVDVGRILAIDPTSASLVFDVGPGAAVDTPGDAAFDWVHDLSVIPCDTHPLCLLYYDNGWSRGWSRVVALGVDPEAGPAEILRTYASEGWFEPHMGGVQQLEDGDWLVARGHSEAHAPESVGTVIVRVAPDGTERWRIDVGPEDRAVYRARRLDPCGFLPGREGCDARTD